MDGIETGTGVGTGTGNGKGGDRRKSSPANTVQQSTGKNSGSGSGSGKQIGASSHAQRRPRSKSGGSEYGMSEKEELTLGASLGRSVGDEFDSNSNVIAIFPDHGSRYMSKIFSDEWMNDQGFFDSKNTEEVQKIEFIK